MTSVPPHIVISLYDGVPKNRLPDAIFDTIVQSIPDCNIHRAISDEDLRQAVSAADVLWCWRYPADLLAAAPNLRWIHSNSVGVNPLLTPEWIAGDITLTNGRGLFTIPMAEWIFGAMLALNLRLPDIIRAQDNRTWIQQTLTSGGQLPTELYGKTLGIIGYGGIGRELAHRARTMEMRVIATRSHPAPDPDLDHCYAAKDFRDMLKVADYVVIAAPLTPETDGMIGADELALMKSTACLINVARGKIVDEAALREALTNGAIRGAAIDAFTKEPLPPDSPWWTTPHLIINPHNSGFSDRLWDRIVDLFLRNLQRYRDGEPLENIVPKDRGY